MLAGNVTASLDGQGNLVITGDSSNNDVVMYRDASGQVLVVGGRNDGTLATRTSVNGQFDPVAFNSDGGLVLNMKDGDDRVLITNFNVQGKITGSLGKGDDEFSLQSTPFGLDAFTLNDGTAPILGNVTVSGLMTINADGGDDVAMMNDAVVTGAVTFNLGGGNDTVGQYGTLHDNNIVGGNMVINGGPGDDQIILNRLAIGQNLTINDGSAVTGSKVTLGNVRANLDIRLFLSIFTDDVTIQGGDVAFRCRNLVLFTGDGDDRVSVAQGVMMNGTIDTGAGDEGNGFYGVSVSGLTVNTKLLIDLGSGFDNAYINNVHPDTLHVFGGSGSDGVIAKNIRAIDALFSLGDSDDVVGLYGSRYAVLDLQLAGGNDLLYAGGLRASRLARFNGGPGSNTYHDVGDNTFGTLERVNI